METYLSISPLLVFGFCLYLGLLILGILIARLVADLKFKKRMMRVILTGFGVGLLVVTLVSFYAGEFSAIPVFVTMFLVPFLLTQWWRVCESCTHLSAGNAWLKPLYCSQCGTKLPE